MARPRSKDFEEIYLRFSTLQRYLPKANLGILNDPDIQTIIRSSSLRYFNKYKSFLRGNGFDFDDLKNLITLWALAYDGIPKEEEMTASHRNAIMTNFIHQRCSFFIKHIARHFDSNDSMVVSFENFSGITVRDTGNYQDASRVSDLDDDDQEKLLEDQIFLLEDKIKKTKGRHERLDLKSDKSAMETELDEVQARIKDKKHEFNSGRKESLARLRALFEVDPHKYSNQLSYYATTKHVAKDVRKKARLLCDKYGIDYREWLKVKLNDPAIESVEFDCS